MKERTEQLWNQFFTRRPDLLSLQGNVERVCEILTAVYRNGGKVLICGNGGSCADGGHIVGELMKGFLLRRPLGSDVRECFARLYGADGEKIAGRLQCGLPAISLNAHGALMSAFSNDVDPELVYAQQVMGYAVPGDAVIGISTSGNAANVASALMAAKVCGASAIALTGRDGGKIAKIADCSVISPQQETYRIQEDHLSLYHLICAFTESELFAL